MDVDKMIIEERQRISNISITGIPKEENKHTRTEQILNL